MHAIETDHLTRAFGDLRAVDNLSLQVDPGEIFGLVGPDGAGKTTTLRLLTALMEPTGGKARVLGRDTVREAEAVKEEIGYMCQRFGLYPDLTVLENIHFYADIYGVARHERNDRIEELLAFSNLTPFKKRQAGKLSGGMKQKLGLACALIHTPRVLFLDEPTNGVDPVSRRDFWRILYRLAKQGMTVFVSTTYLDEAERCTRVGFLHQGKLMAVDTPDGIRTLMEGALLEIVSPQARRIAAKLREVPEALSVSLFGDRVHVSTAQPEALAEKIRSLPAEQGLEVGQIRTLEPSLEDVFVSVLQKIAS